MDKLGDMNLFVHVIKNGGLAVAGRELGLSPASMSTRMNNLEARYGTRLLNRSTRHVSLTEAGQQFYDACVRILADVNEVESELLGNQNELKGSLRITAPSDVGRQLVMPLLSKFVAKNPAIHPYLHLGDGVVNILEEGYDCAIRYGSLADSTLVARKLVTNHRVLCASPEYIKRKGAPKTPQDLSQYDCISLVSGSEPLTNWYFQTTNGIESVIIKATRSSNDGAVARHWAIEGVGIALKSYLEVHQDIKAKRLQIVLENFPVDFKKEKLTQHSAESNSSVADLYIVYPSRQYLPKRVKAFIEMLIKEPLNNLDEIL